MKRKTLLIDERPLSLESLLMRNSSSHKSRCERSGFSLVELLVVIAIIAVMAALMLPAVQMM